MLFLDVDGVKPKVSIKKEIVSNSLNEETKQQAKTNVLESTNEVVAGTSTTAENDDQDDVFGPLEFLHPIAAIHVSLRQKRAQRRLLFGSCGPYRRALSARADLAIR